MKHRQRILKLKPTQFAVGMLEVDEKIKIVQGYNKKQLQDYIDETPVPVVISPDRQLYIVDHHHFLCVCYHLNVKKVRVKVVKDLSKSKMSYKNFWKWMLKNRSMYPYCQFGEGPRQALYLPHDIRGLADDPYRSIAWFVRKAGAFENSEKNFAEFKWANFFRDRKLLDSSGIAGLPAALEKAVRLAQSPAAKNLPGYGRLNIEEKNKAKVKAKEKGKKIALKVKKEKRI
jgi:hypothetical protein